MKWSWRLGNFAGVDVYVHATFLVLIGWIALSHWLRARTVEATLAGVAFVLALFACVLLHEYGHALAAHKFGIRTRDITLLPIGGVARLERMPEEPRQELWVALAGPAVNVAIAAALFAWLQANNGLEPLANLGVAQGSFLERLMATNVMLALFNLIPAFPMDGGRVLRAILASRMEYTKATQIASGIGQGMAFLLGLAGLLTNPFLIFIALFVWIGATQEAGVAQMRSSLAGVPVQRAMMTDFRALAPGDRLSDAVQLILAGAQQDFPVIAGEQVKGVLTKGDLLVALAQHGEDHLVSEVMRRDIRIADSSDMLATAFERLQECECHSLPVLHNGRLVGLLTAENVGEFLMVQSALGGRRLEGSAAA